MTDVLFLLAGFVLLIIAGDILVRGAVALSLRLGVPPMIIGLTIVALGTSLPELFVSIQASLAGSPHIALGNVIGSNIANVLLVLGVPAIIATIEDHDRATKRSFWLALAASLLFAGLCLTGELRWQAGLILMTALLLIMVDAFRAAVAPGSKAADELPDEVRQAEPDMPWSKVALLMIPGLIGLPIGADLLVSGASGLARGLGISEAAIGLTIVAFGTSLPELATSVMAARRGHTEVAIGNVLGSNMFNVLLIIGAATLITDVPVPKQLISFDIPLMIGTMVLLMPFVVCNRRMCPNVGVGFTALYLTYMALVFYMQTGGSA